MKVFGMLAFVASGVLLSSGVAQADTTSYLARIQKELPYVYQQYSSGQLVNEGYRICTYEQQGLNTSGVTDRVVTDLPMSRSAAISLEVFAQHHLGC